MNITVGPLHHVGLLYTTILRGSQMKKVFLHLINFVEVHIASIILLTLFLSMFFQVVLRYVFNYPSPALFEISGYTFIWVVFLGAPLARRFRSHIRFNILYEKFPRKVQLVIDLVMNVAFNIGMLITFFPVLENFGWYKYLKSDVLRIPWTYLLLCFPLFILLIVLHNSVWIYKELKELITGKPGKMEEKPWE